MNKTDRQSESVNRFRSRTVLSRQASVEGAKSSLERIAKRNKWRKSNKKGINKTQIIQKSQKDENSRRKTKRKLLQSVIPAKDILRIFSGGAQEPQIILSRSKIKSKKKKQSQIQKRNKRSLFGILEREEQLDIQKEREAPPSGKLQRRLLNWPSKCGVSRKTNKTSEKNSIRSQEKKKFAKIIEEKAKVENFNFGTGAAASVHPAPWGTCRSSPKTFPTFHFLVF